MQTFQDAAEAYNAIESAGNQHPDFPELRQAFYRAAVRYAHIRATWALLGVTKRANQDRSRTEANEAFISYCNLLGRFMEREGWDAEWRIKLGDDRLDIGDLACHLHAFIGISAR